ncbi:Hypothetical protein PBC10988_0820 [Planctomycetales bacterium 10988]|nr:Hypothetical protein PBC10988_0820 [Planctomycetales bacterium 10988]
MTKGTLRLQAGSIQSLVSSTPNRYFLELLQVHGVTDLDSLLERFKASHPVGEGNFSLWILSQDLLDDDQKKAVYQQWYALQMTEIADSLQGERPEFLTFDHQEPASETGLNFSPFDLFFQAALSEDQFRDDTASICFETWESKLAAGLLLLRPQESRHLPIPVRRVGFDGARIGELIPICRSAREMCEPASLVEAGIEPSMVMKTLDDSAWFCVRGEVRLALLRFYSRQDALLALSGFLAISRGTA